jgi:BirA family biotin operon repressor/biotin-[acetyl-CoA-carboxylase] ligase
VTDAISDELVDLLAANQSRLGDFARLRHLPEVDSTNDVAMTLAESGAPSGASVLADQQHRGRGRRGREWFSPPGAGLYLSIVVRPQRPAESLAILTLAAGVAAAKAVELSTGLPIELKWPNDLVIGRPWRKLGGVLCETVGTGAQIDAVIIGIGINVHPAAYPAELANRATSIETELGRSISRGPLVVELLAHVKDVVARLDAGAIADIARDWRQLARAGLSGAPVRWRDGLSERRGFARDIAADGALLVESGGTIDRIVAGEVIWDRLAHE